MQDFGFAAAGFGGGNDGAGVFYVPLSDPELTISPVWRPEPGKPFVTEMVADLGVLFLFGSVVSLLVGNVFFPKR